MKNAETAERCKMCEIDITNLRKYEVFRKSGKIVYVCEDCYRELQDKGKDGIPATF